MAITQTYATYFFNVRDADEIYNIHCSYVTDLTRPPFVGEIYSICLYHGEECVSRRRMRRKPKSELDFKGVEGNKGYSNRSTNRISKHNIDENIPSPFQNFQLAVKLEASEKPRE